MKLYNRYLLVLVFLSFVSEYLLADSLSDIDNYREYSPHFSSSGQPDAEQLKAVSEAGFKRVIYIAFSDNKSAIDSEDRVVKSFGMDYLHIPVDFDRPTLADFEDFATVMNRDPKFGHYSIVKSICVHRLSVFYTG